ncbi:GtrA family protein [Alcaligenes sp. HNGD-HTN06]|jgi:putative flippase GtrA|uniref:GtrA family protein n=1 Tax=Alcaligenes sp. HNGD-HTN06 TaxID=3416924 RepID=UPI003CF3F2D5
MIMRFGLVSGFGWLIDFVLFTTLTSIQTPVWLANIIGATTAVTFVFFASIKRIFQYDGHYLIKNLVVYLIYQVIAILLASFIIDLITSIAQIKPIYSKIIVTPFTFYANFQFMSYLTTGKLRLL